MGPSHTRTLICMWHVSIAAVNIRVGIIGCRYTCWMCANYMLMKKIELERDLRWNTSWNYSAGRTYSRAKEAVRR